MFKSVIYFNFLYIYIYNITLKLCYFTEASKGKKHLGISLVRYAHGLYGKS